MSVDALIVVAFVGLSPAVCVTVSWLSVRSIRKYRDEMLASNEVLSKQNDLVIAALKSWLGNARSES